MLWWQGAELRRGRVWNMGLCSSDFWQHCWNLDERSGSQWTQLVWHKGTQWVWPPRGWRHFCQRSQISGLKWRNEETWWVFVHRTETYLYIHNTYPTAHLLLIEICFHKCLLGDGHWGIWSYSSCPAGYSVVGFRTKVSPYCDICDNVGLTRAEFKCRPQAGPLSPTICAQASCPHGGCFFMCGDGDCVAASRECDGIPDCGDGSDESIFCWW